MGADFGDVERLGYSCLDRKALEDQLGMSRHRLLDRSPSIDQKDRNVFGAQGDTPKNVKDPPRLWSKA
tara:strand:- start:69 stop:272 length:204 start_codon:yes stop_codon:yes gene_type:complete